MNESTLRQALTDLAATPTPPTFTPNAAVRLHRYRLIRAGVAIGAAVLVLAALIAVPRVVSRRAEPAAPPSTGVSLPSTVDTPWAWTPHVQDKPAGAASLVVSGSGVNELTDIDNESDNAFIGARANSYRLYLCNSGCDAGAGTYLSPDGTHAIGWNGVLDLRTGRERRMTGAAANHAGEPRGWSPDGRSISACVQRDVNDHADWIPYAVQNINVHTGAITTLPGHGKGNEGVCEVAYSPDGRRIAYQLDSTVRVATVDGRLLATFAAPHGAVLAGKGAWTRDGRSIAFVTRTSDGRRLVLVDATTGGVGGPEYPAVSGACALRLLGWRPDGSPLVVAYLPESYRDLAKLGVMDTDANDVNHVTVLSLYRDRAPRVVMMAASGITNLDVADRAIESGRVRPGGRAPLYLNPVWPTAAAVAVILIWTALTFVIVGLLRRTRRPRLR